MKDQFEDIRSYRDNEVKGVINNLLEQDMVSRLLSRLLPDAEMRTKIASISSIHDFQEKLMKPIFVHHIMPTFDELSVSGLDKLEKDKSYLFISNHRDIVLDSAILNYFLNEAGMGTAEIAIGDNLLKDRWIKDIVRLNKSFIVRRNLDKAEMLNASKHMSEYIADCIKNRGESVWIAQRAGRAKDGNDETNPGLITMLSMSAEENMLEHFKELNIVPVSISYEYDPCDIRKTKELYVESKGEEYSKSEKEDVESMQIGIVENKGKGHIHFGNCISSDLEKLDSNDRKTISAHICENLDHQIHRDYRLWPSNEIAESMLQSNLNSISDNLDEARFLKRLQAALIDIQGDKEDLRSIFLGMYAQPAINKRKTN
ncbi:MAG: 1-acyl-sn-glycerol-3-phosphate acyltransferase [Vicingaceae bacterium]